MLACYLRLIRAGFRRYSTYRQAMVAGLATNVVFGFMRCAVLLTVFTGSAQVAGYDPSRTVTFVWIGQGLLAVVLIWGNSDFGERVRSGDVAVDLLRPVDLQAALLAEDLGRASFALLTRFTFPVLIGLAFFDLTLPGSAVRWVAFGLSVLLAILVSFAVRFLLNLVAFWLLDWRGLLALHGAISTVLAGLAIPIAFFPGWARVAIWATPFPAIIQAPIDIAIGAGTVLPLLAHQLFWAVALLTAGRLVLARAIRTLVIQVGEHLVVYRSLLAASVRSQLAYPTSFALQCAALALIQLQNMAVILVLFSRVGEMGGFTRQEVLLIYSLAGISFGLADLLVGPLDKLGQLVRTGTLDALLLRPLSVMAQICASDFAIRQLGKVATALVVLGYVLATSGISWTPLRVAVLLITPLTGLVLLGAIWVAASATTFWLVEGQELPNAVTYGSGMFTSYPMSIFSGWLLRLMAFVVPGAFVAYYPALAILGKPDPLGLPPVLQYSAPLVAVLAAGVAALVWRAGLRHYVGTGS